MTDFNIVDVPGVLAVPVTSYDASGNQIADDGEWHRRATEAQFVLAEFLVAKGLLLSTMTVERTPTLTIKFSELTTEGQAFARDAVHKWLTSVDRPTAKTNGSGLERRWLKFKAETA